MSGERRALVLAIVVIFVLLLLLFGRRSIGENDLSVEDMFIVGYDEKNKTEAARGHVHTAETINETLKLTLSSTERPHEDQPAATSATSVPTCPPQVLPRNQNTSRPPGVRLNSTTVETGEFCTLMHGACESRQPFIDEYNRLFSRARKSRGNETLYDASNYKCKDAVRRFLVSWQNEVDTFRREQKIADTSPAEIRILFIGDSIIRNTFHELMCMVVEEGVNSADRQARYVNRTGDMLPPGQNAFAITWPPPQSATNASSGNNTKQARVHLRFEGQNYFSLDNHNIYETGGLDFDPTHVLIDRGSWDMVHAELKDPLYPFLDFSSGLTFIRKQLLQHRLKSKVDAYPPVRIAYHGLHHFFTGPGTHLSDNCAIVRDMQVHRDALYGAVRRANGALQSMYASNSFCKDGASPCRHHQLRSFSDVAIEFFDSYSLSQVAGEWMTRTHDGFHPKRKLVEVFVEQLFDQFTKPPSTLVAEKTRFAALAKQLAADDSPVSTARMYIPDPMNVVEPPTANATSEELWNKDHCPLGFSPADVAALSALGDEDTVGVSVPTLDPRLGTIITGSTACIKIGGENYAPWLVDNVMGIIKRYPQVDTSAPNRGPLWIVLDKCIWMLFNWLYRYRSLQAMIPESFKKHPKDNNVISGHYCLNVMGNLTQDVIDLLWSDTQTLANKPNKPNKPCAVIAFAATGFRGPGARALTLDANRVLNCLETEHQREKKERKRLAALEKKKELAALASNNTRAPVASNNTRTPRS